MSHQHEIVVAEDQLMARVDAAHPQSDRGTGVGSAVVFKDSGIVDPELPCELLRVVGLGSVVADENTGAYRGREGELGG